MDYVLYNNYQLGKVTKYSTKDDGSLTIDTYPDSKDYKSAKVVGFEDVALNDYVVYNTMGGKLYVAKSETVTGTLNADLLLNAGLPTEASVGLIGVGSSESHTVPITWDAGALDFSPADIVASFERRQGCPSCGAAVQESSIDTPEQLKNASQGFTDDAHLAELVRNLIASMNH